ncbi:hypothetical protein BGY98DRAFT_959994 [Russula aff. rugulosa BPL654]|nr:hypothetical protein BGY98DRAFT_959994 [Russula aff. rugulosa BPL654]
MPHSVPQILINKTPVTHINPDVCAYRCLLVCFSPKLLDYTSGGRGQHHPTSL